MIYSKYCDDPESMVIMDLVTGKVYGEEEARKEVPEIRRRLVNHCTKQGYWVLSLEELNDENRRRD